MLVLDLVGGREMNLRTSFLGTTGLAATIAALGMMETDAHACGGCFIPPSENPSVVTDHRMIFSVSKEQTTLYDQIKYTGEPGSFGWVLPISSTGTITVGLSADVVFAGLDRLTVTQLRQPPLNCPGPPSSCFGSSSSSGTSGGTSGGLSAAEGGVTVVKREVVGPYETVQLKSDTQDALQIWLTQNGFKLPEDVKPVVAQYTGSNFLALKLVPGKGIQDMRPVRVTTQGGSVTLPLRMVAAGTGPVVGISLWVVADGRYEPQNFGSFTIATEEITWDWAQSKSNYTDLRAQKTTLGNGKVWEVESSTVLYRQQLEQIVKQGSSNSGPFPSNEEDRALVDYLPVKNEAGTVTKTAVQAREEDMTALFYGIPTSTSRVTRLRADLAHAALDADLILRAASDQAVLSNVRQITKEINQPQCPVYTGCTQTGTAPRDQVPGGSGAGSSAGGDGTFTCATGPRHESAWMAVGLGFAAIASAHAIRRRRRNAPQ
jgi:hypothetical protein